MDMFPMTDSVPPAPSTALPSLSEARVHHVERLCREHYLMTLSLAAGQHTHYQGAAPGQFVHLKPQADDTGGGAALTQPLLRRAFSISDMRTENSGDGASRLDVDIIYRVVGQATVWLAGLHVGDAVSVIGPLGQPFPTPSSDVSILVAGGVGLPPLLWHAEKLRAFGQRCVVFYGAQTRDLLAIPLGDSSQYATDGSSVTLSGPDRFSAAGAELVISTDDGSLGFKGYAPQALALFLKNNELDASRTAIYTCGPEVMMKAVAEVCRESGVEGFLCMERSMACGTGTCQSCVVEVADEAAVEGWRYSLCCTEGPVYSSNDVLWSVAR
ncbi:MAG: dihydroorotate dehydrogenase electron transfer subunit, partial [Phycisphaerae bacterium]